MADKNNQDQGKEWAWEITPDCRPLVAVVGHHLAWVFLSDNITKEPLLCNSRHQEGREVPVSHLKRFF